MATPYPSSVMYGLCKNRTIFKTKTENKLISALNRPTVLSFALILFFQIVFVYTMCTGAHKTTFFLCRKVSFLSIRAYQFHSFVAYVKFHKSNIPFEILQESENEFSQQQQQQKVRNVNISHLPFYFYFPLIYFLPSLFSFILCLWKKEYFLIHIHTFIKNSRIC